jgi:DNA repair protein RecO (recombination protein O)
VSMVERVELDASFLLHSIPYRETSQILEVFSQTHGRVGLVAKGSRRPKSRWTGALRPFQLSRMSWSGRGSLCTLRAAEPSGLPVKIDGMALMGAYYMNELLIGLMRRGDPHPDLFTHYGGALAALADGDDTELVLRRFEVALLFEIGYGISADRSAGGGEPLEADRQYEYVMDYGPVPVEAGVAGDMIFSGAELLAISRGEFQNAEELKSAKRLLRAALRWILGDRILKTRQVTASMQR